MLKLSSMIQSDYSKIVIRVNRKLNFSVPIRPPPLISQATYPTENEF